MSSFRTSIFCEASRHKKHGYRKGQSCSLIELASAISAPLLLAWKTPLGYVRLKRAVPELEFLDENHLVTSSGSILYITTIQ
jgi:hypothetical protein